MDAAERRLQGLSASQEADSLVFAFELAQTLPHFDVVAWRAKLQAASVRAAESSWNDVIGGMRQIELGHLPEGRALIESGLLLPDRNLAHHFGRQAIRGAKPPTQPRR